MSIISPNILMWNIKKPPYPINGDTYFDAVTNKVYTFKGGNWIEYRLFIPQNKNEIRINKIRNLLR